MRHCQMLCEAISVLRTAVRAMGWFDELPLALPTEVKALVGYLGVVSSDVVCIWKCIGSVVGFAWHPNFDAIDLCGFRDVHRLSIRIRSSGEMALVDKHDGEIVAEIRRTGVVFAESDYCNFVVCQSTRGVFAVDVETGMISECAASMLEFIRVLSGIAGKGVALRPGSWRVVRTWGDCGLQIGDIVESIGGSIPTEDNYVEWLMSGPSEVQVRRGSLNFLLWL